MARRPSEDVVGFRRIFVLFCTLVVVPAMAASGFGIIAIKNEASAEKQRIRERAEARIAEAEVTLLEQFNAVGTALDTSPRPPVEVLHAVRRRGGPVGTIILPTGLGDPAGIGPLVYELQDRAERLVHDAPAPTVAHFLGADGRMVVAVHMLRSGVRVAYIVNEKALASGLTPLQDADDAIQISLRSRPAADDAVVGALENFVAEVVGTTDRSGRVLVAQVRLPPPYDRFRLVARALPPAGGLRWTYIALLLAFYAALITGVVLVSRLIWRETKLSRLKTDFVSHVSHELRTPLTSIRMFIETLRLGRAQSPEDQEECLELLSKETERLSDMIERVLGYARLKSGRRIFSLQACTPETLVRDALDAFRAHTVFDDHITSGVSVDIEAALPSVQADREAIVEVLVNLLGNAFKYTGPDKRIRVFSFLRRSRVVFGVEDNGPGLDKSEHKRIFDRFYRVGPLLSQRSQEGSGLGLAISKGIVDGHHGRMSVESVVGSGSTFTFELPISDVAADPAMPRESRPQRLKRQKEAF